MRTSDLLPEKVVNPVNAHTYRAVCVARENYNRRYDRSQRVISRVFRLSFAFIRRTNYSSCHGCSFVDGVFIPMRKSPITSRENCLSLQSSEVSGKRCRDNAPTQCALTLYSSSADEHRDVSITTKVRQPIHLIALVINRDLKNSRCFLYERIRFYALCFMIRINASSPFKMLPGY